MEEEKKDKNLEVTEGSVQEQKVAKRLEKKPGILKNKKVLIILGIAILAIVIVAVLFIFRKIDEVPQDTTPPVPYQVIDSTTGEVDKEVVKEMAQEIVTYIKSQKRSDGYYNYIAHPEKQCLDPVSSEDCPFSGETVYETTNSWTALALYSGSQILGDTSLLNEAVEDIRKLDEYCSGDRSQCDRVAAQPAIIYNGTNRPALLDFLTSQKRSLLSAPATNNPMLGSIEARSIILLNNVDHKPSDLIIAKQRLDNASVSHQKIIQNIYANSDTQFRASSCWLALSSIEYEKETGGNYTNVAAFLDNGKLVENFSQIVNPIEIQPCIESYLNLYGFTNNELFLSKSKKLMNLFIQGFYDGSKAKKIYGEGGTRLQSEAIEDESSSVINLTDSSYTLYILNLLNKYEN